MAAKALDVVNAEVASLLCPRGFERTACCGLKDSHPRRPSSRFTTSTERVRSGPAYQDTTVRVSVVGGDACPRITRWTCRSQGSFRACEGLHSADTLATHSLRLCPDTGVGHRRLVVGRYALFPNPGRLGQTDSGCHGLRALSDVCRPGMELPVFDS